MQVHFNQDVILIWAPELANIYDRGMILLEGPKIQKSYEIIRNNDTDGPRCCITSYPADQSNRILR